MAHSNISIRVDENVKKEAENLFAELGLTLSAATNIFYRQAVKARGIPFYITAVGNEPPKRTREAILARGKEAMREAQAQAIINGTSEMTLEEINEIIAECRKESIMA